MCRGWPEELGGQWYPEKRGKYSTEFLQQLQQDRPDVPSWLDPEDASNAAAADKVPPEKFALMPLWVGVAGPGVAGLATGTLVSLATWHNR